MPSKRLYFAHPINLYGTDFERECLDALAKAFPGWIIVNPGASEHDEGYRRYIKVGRRGMDYFFTELLPSQHGVVFLGFPDRKIGTGVFEEAQRILARTGKAWEITPDGLIVPVARIDPRRCLTVDETRHRVYLNRAKHIMRPYSESGAESFE